MLNPRAIAVQGIGFLPRAIINMGYFDSEIVIEPEFSPGGGRTVDDVKQYKLYFKFTDHLGRVTKETHTLSQGELFLKLKYEKMVIIPLTIKARLRSISNPIKIAARILK